MTEAPRSRRLAVIRFLWRGARRLFRWLRTAAIAIIFVAATVMAVLRFFVLPHVDEFRDRIAVHVSAALGQRVTLGALTGGWHGANPRVTVRDVTVHGADGRPAFHLDNVEAVVAWRSLFAWELRCRSLILQRPDVTIRRDPSGTLSVGGIPVPTGESTGRFPQWLMAQSVVQIQNATLRWHDDRRGAPPLVLTDVTVHIENRGRAHRFGLQARPGVEVGTFVDVRGDFRGARSAPLERMRGRAYLTAPYLNLGAARTWVDLPVTFASGAGAVDAWVDVGGGRVEGATVDLRAAGVVASPGAGLASLEVPELQGRLTWLATAEGFEASARRLAIGVGGGAFLPPADVVIRHRSARPGRTGRLQVESDRLDLAPISYVLSRLPVDESLREAIARYHPTGRVEALAFVLERGDGQPRYSVRTRFEDVAVAATGRVPGIAGLSGAVTASDGGGELTLTSRGVTLTAPALFVEPINAAALDARAEWRTTPDGVAVRLHAAEARNDDVAVRAKGTYIGSVDRHNVVDLVVDATSAKASAVWRYLPTVVGAETRAWLRRALRAGVAREVRAVLQGDLAAFPFSEGPGRFEVTAVAEDVELAIDPAWPLLEQVSGTVSFRGRRMDIEASGRTLGARIHTARIAIPDLGAGDPLLEINGDARGPAAEFIRYVNASPVGGWLDGFTRNAKVGGDGALTLGLVIPLSHMADARVRGAFTFAGNSVDGLEDVPPLSHVGGVLEFSEKGARMPFGSADLWGMPTRFGLSVNSAGAVTLEARGRANVERLRSRFAQPLLARLSGETEWKATASVRNNRFDLTVDSDLRGLGVDLPPPFAKAPADTWPGRYLQRGRDKEQSIGVTLGDKVSVATLWSTAEPDWRLARAAIAFGSIARVPDRDGVAITGSLSRLNVEQWQGVAALASPEAQGGGAARGTQLPVSLDLRIGTIEAMGRELHEAVLRVQRRPDLWGGQISSREVEGSIDWIPTGRGRLIARLARRHIPEATSAITPTESSPTRGQDLPAIDVTAQSFRVGAMDLGRLELRAVPNGPTWQLQRLDLHNPDAHLTAEGAWQLLRGKPRTQLAVRLEVEDIGHLLKRMNGPPAIARGSARLVGVLEWDGTPVKFDAPTLGGRLSLEARKGQFLEMEPGLGRLLGILSLQALPRRLSLDFRDVFGKGYEFDEITANSTIAQGVMRTTDFRMSGSAAKVEMKGEVDIARETQVLDVRVIPSVQDSLAVGTAIAANPLAGLAALLLGRVFDNPIGRAAAFDYHVTGTWSDPIYTKASASRPAPRPETPGRR
ncbi:MAG: YhdP family protein [Burkholderiales bacterium]